MLLDSRDYVLEEDFGREGVAVVDDWLPIVSIPAVHWGTQEESEYSHILLKPYRKSGNFRVIKCLCDNVSCCKIFVVWGYPRNYFNGVV